MEICLPAKKEIIEQEDISDLLKPYNKLYLIFDSIMPRDDPVLDIEGRAVCFTDSVSAEKYASKYRDAQSRVFDPMGLTQQALRWRFFGIKKFLLCTADQSEEHDRAELIGRYEKYYLGSEYNFLQIRLRLAWKYYHASMSKKKYESQDIDYKQLARLREYELYSFMSHELLLLLPLIQVDKNDKLDRNTLIITPNASAVMAMKGINAGNIASSILGGEKLRIYTDNISFDSFHMISIVRNSDDRVFIPYFIDKLSFDKMFRDKNIVPLLVTFDDLVFEIKAKNENEKDRKIGAIIDPDGASEFALTANKAEVINVTGQDKIPEHIRQVSGKHIRINITGGKNNGCNS